MKRCHGFTLIELVLVMIIISVGMIGIATSFSNTSKSLSVNETLQQAGQYAQECAETVMRIRREKGFTSSSINNTMCGSSPSGFTRTVTVGSTYTGPASGACNGNDPCPCPSGITCRDIGISVTSGSLSSSITIMLVNYL